MPDHEDVVFRNNAATPFDGQEVYAAYGGPLLVAIPLPYIQPQPQPSPKPVPPVPMPRTYIGKMSNRYQQRAPSSSSDGTRVESSSSHGKISTTTHSCVCAGDATGDSTVMLTEEYVLQQPRRDSSLRYSSPRETENSVAAWKSYLVVAGTFIVLTCFAVLAFSFVTETTLLFPAEHSVDSEHERALSNDHKAQPMLKARESTDLLAESRSLFKHVMAAKQSTSGQQDMTKLTRERRRSRSSPRAFPLLFPRVDGETTQFTQTDHSTTSLKQRPTLQWDDSICWTEACLVEGAAIKSSLDLTVNPCDDFYAYACNHWKHERPLPRGQAVVSVDLDFLDVFTQDVFNVLGRGSSNKLFEKLRRLLQACVASPEDFFPRLARQALLSVDLGGWPYDDDVDADTVSVSTTLGRMVSSYDLDPVFGLSLVSDPASATGMRITFAFSGPDPLLNEGIEEGREYSFVRQAYEVLVEAVGEKSVYDPVETDVHLARVFLETASIVTAALALKNCTRTSVQELPQMGEWLFWEKMFAELEPGGRSSSIALNETEVQLPDPLLFERLNETRLLSSRGSKSKMANYLGFRLLLLLSPFGTGVDDKNVPASLAYALHRNYPTSLHDYQACLRLVDRFEPVVAMHRLHGDWKERIVKPDDLIEMVSFLKTELSSCLKTSSLFFSSSTNVVWKALLDFLNGISWQVLNAELMEHTWTFEHLSGVYEQLNVSDPGSVISFLQSAVRSRRDASSDLSAVQWKGGFLSTTANIAHPYKVLEIPLPVFNLQRTLDESVRHLQIARIAPKIFYSIYKALYFVSGNLALDNMTWNPIRYFDTAADCLWDRYSYMLTTEAKASLSSPYERRTRDLDDLFSALAVGSSLDAYLSFVAAKKKLYRLKGSEDLDITRLFFVEYARNLCENTDLGFHAARNQARTLMAARAPRSQAWYQVNGPLINLKEFAKAFSCKEGSFMNPSNKCPLIRKHR